MTEPTPATWQGLDVIVDETIPAGYAELRDKDGQVVVTLKLGGRHLAIAPTNEP
jgi:hypothetical protein